MKALAAHDLNLSFGSKNVLKDLNFQIEAGDFVCLLGPSGCGKSTLLRVMAGLLGPTSGAVSFPTGEVSFVFQEPRLLPWRTSAENVLLPFELKGALKNSEGEAKKALQQVGLFNAADLYPHQLSGGMRQRVAIARALVTNPAVVFMDEPFSALDEKSRHELQDLLRKIWQGQKTTFVFVTHSLSEAAYLGERILLMSQDGKFVRDVKTQLGARNETLRTGSPLNQVVADLSRALHE